MKGTGYNADFLQKKTRRRCVVPIPKHVVEMLNACLCQHAPYPHVRASSMSKRLRIV